MRLFAILPYMDQDPLHNQIVAQGTLAAAVSNNIVTGIMPFQRCPIDNYDVSNPMLCNYIGSMGPQCNNPPTGNCNTPIFQPYCNGDNSGQQVPNTLTPLTFPGCDASATWGSPITGAPLEGDLLRGMFCRGGTIVKVAHVTDGTSNTILLGELLPEFSEFQRYTTDGWLTSNDISQGNTIQPINWPIDRMPQNPAGYAADCMQPAPFDCPNGPTHCMWNWHVTWGFHSNHPGGANFAFVDGSVHFLSNDIDHQTYQYLGCRNDNQSVNLPW